MIPSWNKKLIDLYIFKQVLYPLMIGILLIKVIMLSGFLYEMADLIIIEQIPVAEVVELLIYQLPEIIVETFPMAILFGTIYGLGRLNRDNEFTALRMGGVSLYRLVIPLVILGVLVSGLTFLLNERVVPWANHRAQNIIRLSILKQAAPDVQEDVFFEGPEGRLFFVNEFNEELGRVFNIVIFNKSSQSKYPEIITAERGEIRENIWFLSEGVIHSYDEHGQLELAGDFEDMEIQVARDISSLYGRQRTPREMSRRELKSEIELFQKSGISVVSLVVDYHLKLATPFIPLIFILIGAPLSLGKNSSRAAGIVFTIVIIFLYYFMQSLLRSLGRNGMIPPLAAAWTPNIVFALAGLVLIYFRTAHQRVQTKLNKLRGLFKLLKSTLFFSCIFMFLFSSVFSLSVFAEQRLNLEADKVTYGEQGIELSGSIRGRHKNVFLQADRINVVREDGETEELEGPLRIDITTGKMSGCDEEVFHYYFQAREATIYPGDYLTARHVVFYELGGSLPLFYWPYLYLSLKEEDEGIIPSVGYNERRGWFVKIIYNYILDEGNSGSLYLDYFTRTGAAAGFKHYFIREEGRESYLYFYNQQNKINLRGLFDYQTRFTYLTEGEEWDTDIEAEYTRYDEYREVEGRANLDYSDQERRETIFLHSDFAGQDYDDSTADDIQELELDFEYQRYLGDYWLINFQYGREYLLEPEQEAVFRWETNNFIRRRSPSGELRLIMERYDPEFNSTDNGADTTYYRWPEINYEHYLPFDFIYHFSLGRYREEGVDERAEKMLHGLEYDTRFSPAENIYLNTNYNISNNFFRLPEREEKPVSYQLGFTGETGLEYRWGANSTGRLDHFYSNYLGRESPLGFDRIYREHELQAAYNYSPSDFDLELETGYDILNRQFLPLLGEALYQVTPHLNLGAEASYNIEDRHPEDLILAADYKRGGWAVESSLEYDFYKAAYQSFELSSELERENWNLNLGLERDFTSSPEGIIALQGQYESDYNWRFQSGLKYEYLRDELKEWDNQFIYEVEDLWYVEILHSQKNEFWGAEYDLETVVKRNFHCRELWFSYNHAQRQFTVEYVINLLPEHGFEFGLGEDRELSFDLGITELLE